MLNWTLCAVFLTYFLFYIVSFLTLLIEQIDYAVLIMGVIKGQFHGCGGAWCEMEALLIMVVMGR